MSYLVLARKYRPRRFEDVVGQDVVTRVLRGAIAEGRIGHAYLFSGPRGTGKTTMARLFAKALNCEQGPTPEPCGTCERCQASDGGQEFDVVEIDAASNTSVNDVRDLRDQVAYAPLKARYKVYIVDEVHMLSKAAFNALLKTLEEPPPHVVFLFATTELHKVLDTILSRCQVLRLSAIREEEIALRLKEVFRREQIEPGPGLVEELARRARGGLRDALSLSDQLLALAGDRPALEDLARLAGAAGRREWEQLLEHLCAGDRASVLEAVGGHLGREAELCSGLLDVLRSALVAALCGENTPLVEGGPEAGARLAGLARRIGLERAELWLSDLLRARERLRWFPGQERIALESTLLDLCRPELTQPLSELVARLEALEGRLSASGGWPTPDRPATQSAPKPAPAPAPAREEPTPPGPAGAPREGQKGAKSPAAGAPSRSESAGDPFRRAIELLRGRQPALAELLSHRARVESLEGPRVQVVLGQLSDNEKRLVQDERNTKALELALCEAIGRTVALELAFGPRAERPAAADDSFTRGVADLFQGRIEEL